MTVGAIIRMRHINFLALVALKLLVSLISRLVARSARIVADRQTNRQTHRTTTVTLAAHARRGLCVSVCLSVCPDEISDYRLRGGLWAIPTASVPQGLENECGDFTKTTAFGRYGVKRS